MTTLHVTNGDAAVAALQAAGIEGEFLPWRDLLHDGPVRDVEGELFRRERAAFIAARGKVEYERVLADLEERDARLANWSGPVTLWFEQDLYDQLQLAQILDRLAERDHDAPVTLAQSDDYLTSLSPDEFRALEKQRRPVTDELVREGRDAWRALTGSDPREIERLAVGDMHLPSLRSALRRLLEELPGTADGLSRSERQIMEALGVGMRTIPDLYRAAHREREEAYWLGDTWFAWYLERLVARRLVRVDERDGEKLYAPSGDEPIGEATPRWLGGIWLGESPLWWWDGQHVRRHETGGEGEAAPRGRMQPLAPRPNRDDDELIARAAAIASSMRRRRTVREFSDRAVPRAVIESCIAAAASAPSGANMQPWHFVAVSDPELKRRIRQAAEEEEREFYNGRAPAEWLEALAPLGTDDRKPFLERAPWLIAIFVERYGLLPDGRQVKHYYAVESVGIAAGMLITALHETGLATLTHTPSPMNFLNELLGRPANERPFLLLVVGHPIEGCGVPDIRRRGIDAIATFFESGAAE